MILSTALLVICVKKLSRSQKFKKWTKKILPNRKIKYLRKPLAQTNQITPTIISKEIHLA
jgi:hypothetical protein